MKNLPDPERKHFFSSCFRELTTKYTIRGLALAEVLGVTPQYVSKLMTGKNLPGPLQLERILAFLEKRKVTTEERRKLVNGYIREKTGFFLEFSELEFNAHDVWERRLLADFRQLTLDQKKTVLKSIAELAIQAL